MTGFNPGWLRAFSKRTQAIKEHPAGAGPENADPKLRMRADDAASLATRPRKDGSLTPEALRERWQAEADGIGMPTGHVLEAQVCQRTIPILRRRVEWDDVVDALIEPEEGLCARRARFNAAHVVEHIAALGAGRLTVEGIEELAEAFLASEHAVPLAERAGRRSAQYSTVDHLLLERRVLDLLEDLSSTRFEAIEPTLVERAIASEAPGLGIDQIGAVSALCASGPAIRTVIAPAGFGKTTTVHAAATAASADGRPVVGLAATNQAAGELRQAGVNAMTIARFALDGAGLPPGAVVVLDEVSQVATSDAEIVLAAVAARPNAILWCLGDPHQAQAVRAGGLGAELVRLGSNGEIPAPELTENRRQLEPAERQALARYRSGLVGTSQAIRKNHGWEHDLGSAHATREALADAVVADIAAHRPTRVVAVAVSHADCEDLADRIRSRLRAAGNISGPELNGPGWGNSQRGYAAGDRLLVHGTVRSNGRRLHNGSVVTTTAVTEDGQFLSTRPAERSRYHERSSKAVEPTAARTAPMPGPAPSTAYRAAPGPRSTSSGPPPSSASPATPPRAAPGTPPTPGTSPAFRRSTTAGSSPTSAFPNGKSSMPSAGCPTAASLSVTHRATSTASSPNGPNFRPCSGTGRPTADRRSDKPTRPRLGEEGPLLGDPSSRRRPEPARRARPSASSAATAVTRRPPCSTGSTASLTTSERPKPKSPAAIEVSRSSAPRSTSARGGMPITTGPSRGCAKSISNWLSSDAQVARSAGRSWTTTS